uniref:Uncharacterized protein n=1 Tax=Dunaliella tertiolecta TaxID=3047 RepID=A0A7S3QZW4_DUNTE
MEWKAGRPCKRLDVKRDTDPTLLPFFAVKRLDCMKARRDFAVRLQTLSAPTLVCLQAFGPSEGGEGFSGTAKAGGGFEGTPCFILKDVNLVYVFLQIYTSCFCEQGIVRACVF